MQFKIHYVLKCFLPWNGWIIFSRLNPIKEFATSFINLHAVHLLIQKKILSLTLFKIIAVSGLSILLRVFLMGRSGHPTTWGHLGGLPASQKVWTFPFCWISPPLKNWVSLSPITDYILKKKISLIAFRQILSKILPEACIFSNTVMTYLKKFVGTKSLNTNQCPAGLSPRIIPQYPRKHLWETLRMERNPTQQPKI